MTAAASIVVPSPMLRSRNFEWQQEAWRFYKALGAFKYAMLWFSQTMSRVRLTAALTPKTQGEPPEIVDSGAAYDLVREFFNGTAGQSQFMKDIAIQLNVPGEGYVAMYDEPDEDKRCYIVRSITQLRPSTGRAAVNGRSQRVTLWEDEVDSGVWRKLPPETYVFRMWQPDGEKSFLPDSPAQAALPVMRVIDMMERRVIAQSVSRLASNGLLLYPSEVTFPVKPGYEKSLDPFTAEWLDIAAKTIENPGGPLAALPMPIKVPREYIKDFTHLDFANTYDERLMEILNLFYDKLGVAMNMPKEVVTGMGNANHWNVWGLDEQGIEVHIKPHAELICAGLTKGYLHPSLKAANEPTSGPDGRDYIVWYDTSELDVPPDRSAAADAAYDRQAINREAYVNAKGFSKDVIPTDEELREQLLIQMAKDPASAPQAIEELTGKPIEALPSAAPAAPVEPVDENQPTQAPPQQRPGEDRSSGAPAT